MFTDPPYSYLDHDLLLDLKPVLFFDWSPDLLHDFKPDFSLDLMPGFFLGFMAEYEELMSDLKSDLGVYVVVFHGWLSLDSRVSFQVIPYLNFVFPDGGGYS